MPAIEIKNLTKKFGNTTAVNKLNLSVNEGEIVGFLGPNGAGKTTTVRIIVGLSIPTEGSVSVMGYDIQKDSVKVKEITGFIPDRPYIYEKLTGMEFLKFTSNIYNKGDHIKKINEMLELFELDSYKNELIESYSHGMKQKLAIISALIHRPEVLIIDEPMVGLDPKSARILKEVFKNLAKKGKTIFLSTHSMEIVEKLCNRIAIIKNGELIAFGTLAELRQVAKSDNTVNLEDIFLELTGAPDLINIIKYL